MSERKLPFVWELRKDGVVSHAIGTLHATPDIYSQDAENYLMGKELLMTEVDIGAKNFPVEIRRRARKLVRIPLSTSLDKLTEEEARELAQTLNMPLDELRSMPAAEFGTYLLGPEIIRSGKAVDVAFYEQAVKLGISTIGLETFDEQLQSLEGHIHDQPNRIRKLLERERTNPGWLQTVGQELIRSYIEGDAERLRELILSTISPDFVTQRNAGMVSRSLENLAKPCTIAVGAGHYVIEPSMLTMYQEKGIEVKRIH